MKGKDQLIAENLRQPRQGSQTLPFFDTMVAYLPNQKLLKNYE